MAKAFKNTVENLKSYFNNYIEIVESLDDLIHDGIFRSDPKRNILYGNAALIRMFGYGSFHELMSVLHNDLFADEEERIHLINKMEAENLIIDHRILLKRKNGQNFFGLFSGIQLVRNGVLVWEGKIQDISGLIKIEEQLKDNEARLEKLTMEFDRFIYSASHDIRSPVSTILGVINIMKADMKDDSARKYIAMIETSMTRLDDFVHELTAYGKNSKKLIKDEHINFDTLVENILLEFKDVHPLFALITWSLEFNIENPFYSDGDRLHLILFNIIKNALDYCGQYKSNRIISIHIQTEQDKALIDIFDNGIGIATKHIDHVFDMFYRATDISKGPGIGLYTTREAVIMLGGIITLDSVYGVGTTVKIKMPNSRKGKLINKKILLKETK